MDVLISRFFPSDPLFEKDILFPLCVPALALSCSHLHGLLLKSERCEEVKLLAV